MDVKSTWMTPQIAIELGANVPKFVENRLELFFDRVLQEPRQVETQNVKHLTAGRIVQPLDSPLSAPALRGQVAAFEAHGCQRGVQSMGNRLTCLAEVDRDAPQIDVFQLRKSTDHVVTQAAHVRSKIETLVWRW